MDDLHDDELKDTEGEEDELFLGEDEESEDDEMSEDDELDAFGMHVEDDEDPDSF